MIERLEQRRMLSFTVSSGTLTVTGTSNPDKIFISKDGTNLKIVENGVSATTPAAAVTKIVVNGNAGNDELKLAIGAEHGIALPATLNGGDGNDRLLGGDGNDVMNGGNGNDFMNGGPKGKDNFNGGAGRDVAAYDGRTSALFLSNNGVADDGAAGEGDNIATDVEDITGGNGADSITGSSGNNALKGNGGNDTMNGGGGNDNLRGDDGNDVLNGGDANDVLVGGRGADVFNGGAGIDTADYHDAKSPLSITLNGVNDDGAIGDATRPAEKDNVKGDVENITGGAGPDKITGNGSANRLIGGPGNDTIRGGGGNDTITGGPGLDQLFGDAGNDLLHGKDNTNETLNGGDGDDSSSNDAGDILTSIEHPNQTPPPPPPPPPRP